ncbi:MAG TPA: pyridoxal phosphate-dependent aminotransferase [Terriglobia bacterium]|nr:pyridoxal phosphate-dependent aminotransferase [Terriglobia bacterium]
MKVDTKGRIAKRMQEVHGEAAFEMLGRATELERQGRSIIHLEIGEPDFDTPAPVVEAGIEWLKKGATHYSPTPGLWELRVALARHLNSRHPAKIDPKNVLVTPGAKMMIFAIIQSIVDPGDEVIYPDPGYPAYEAAIRLAGATPVPIRLEESKEFRFDLNELARLITPRTKMIAINSPQNPTGGVLTLADLKKIAELARKHDLLILSDEIYSEIYYADRPASILDVPNILDRVFIVNGFSKIYAMTGWRLGYGIVPEDTFPAIDLFINNTVSSTATFTQLAAMEAFTVESQRVAEEMVQEFHRRRDVFVNGLNSIPGIHCLKPLGAFYLFPNISGTGLASAEFANRLLNEAGVAALPGTAFGDYGAGYLRFSFANSLSNIESALERIRNFVTHI